MFLLKRVFARLVRLTGGVVKKVRLTRVIATNFDLIVKSVTFFSSI